MRPDIEADIDKVERNPLYRTPLMRADIDKKREEYFESQRLDYSLKKESLQFFPNLGL